MAYYPFQQRVIDECSELSDKITSLANAFSNDMFLALERNEQRLLKLQFDIMVEYKDVLMERIEGFKQ